MIQTIRVQDRNPKDDLKGAAILQALANPEISQVRTARVYRLEGISEKDAKLLAEKLFSEKINQVYSQNAPLARGNYKTVEIAYKPGVMNPEVGSILKAASDLRVNLAAADSSTEYYFYDAKTDKEIKEAIEKLNLYNKLVEHIVLTPPKTLRIKGTVGATKKIPIRQMTDHGLEELSSDKLFLNLEEMKVIQAYFKKIKRDPTDCEIETLAQTWSEHSGHKTFRAELLVNGKKREALIRRIKKEALKHKKMIVSAFVDNSGAIDFYDGFAICGKAETHNSPSAIEPYGGAMTGSGGVFRDIVATGQGAKTIISTDIFCTAYPDMPPSLLPPGTLPPKYILKRLVEAVRDYGNRMGIPTNNGSFHFANDFRAKPTVLVGAYGILPKSKAQKGQVMTGDIVVSIGGRVGRDGIHGATFSSGEMTHKTISVNAQAVQIGNAIEEKRTFDAILEARDLGLIRAIQDSGGGGLSSAVGEMGAESGVRVHLENERVKYPGLSPWEIWVSESQERMILAIPKNKLESFKKVCRKYNVEMSELGEFTNTKRLEIYYGRQLVADLDMEFLHEGLPQRKMVAKLAGKQSTPEKAVRLKNNKEWTEAFGKVLSDGNICSKEPILRLYDHTIQGKSVVQPFSGKAYDGPNDAAVVRPILGKPYGMVVSNGLNPILNNYDVYWSSIWAGVEALSNYVAVGGNFREAALINNYVWPFPDEESLATLNMCVDAVVDLMKTFETPVVSGKDSLSSTYRGKNSEVIKIPPVLCISVFGRIPDVAKTQTADFKKEGSTILLVGKQDLQAMGGTVLHQVMNNTSGRISQVDLKNLPKVFDSIHQGIVNGKILSCHDVSEGGAITSIFEMCVGGKLGAVINIPKNFTAENFLFNETVGCFIVEVENEKEASALFKNVKYEVLGKTTKDTKISALQNEKVVFEENIEALAKVWKEPMEKMFA